MTDWFIVRRVRDGNPIAAFPDVYTAKGLAQERTHELREEYEHVISHPPLARDLALEARNEAIRRADDERRLLALLDAATEDTESLEAASEILDRAVSQADGA